MSERQSLIGEIRKMETIQTDLGLISQRTDAARKLELVHLRRQLSLQIGVIGAEADKYFSRQEDDNIAREFRTLLSAMRRATALHQANWPAVELDDHNAEYLESVKAVREANAAFLKWTKDNIKG